MRILHVIRSVDPRAGGPIQGIIQLRGALTSIGHSNEVVSLDAPDAPFIPSVPLPVYAVGSDKSGYGYSDRLIPWLVEHAREYDMVIANGLWQFNSYATWKAMTKIDAPYMVYTHGMLDPWFKRQYPLKHLKKSLYWPWGEYRILRDAARVCFTSEDEKILARQSFRKYDCREAVVNYGTGTPQGDPAKQKELFLQAFPQARGRRLITFLGRIHLKKGPDLLIRAFAKLASGEPDLMLAMVGHAEVGLQPQLEHLAESLGVGDRILWTGMVQGDLKWGAFYASEAFALPSHQENFGIAVAEALACGVPVLISDKVNIWREILHDNAGLAAPDTADGTVEILENWLKLDKSRRAEMSKNAKACFDSRFRIEKAASCLMDLVRVVQEERGTVRADRSHASGVSQ